MNRKNNKARYKIITNSNKMTNVEFSCYVKQLVKQISTTNIVVNYIYQKDDFQRYTGAIIKYL